MALKNILFPIKLLKKKLTGGEGDEEEIENSTGGNMMPIYIIIGILGIALAVYLFKKSQ